MTKVKMDSKETLIHLTALLGRLAQAMSWVSQQKEKRITFEVRQDIRKDQPKERFCETCHEQPVAAVVDQYHAEILLGILKQVTGKRIRR